MAPKKSTGKQTSKKLSVRRETLKDLNAGTKAKQVKGGSIVNCATRDRQG